MTTSHILGFPRIGDKRQLKFAVEKYWRGELTANELEAVAHQLRKDHWQIQADAGLDFVSVGDFSYYDQVLDLSVMLGVIPPRFGHNGGPVDLNTLFCMARGQAPGAKDAPASEMTKWFNTNYHYIVPEFTAHQTFKLSSDALFKAIEEAQSLGHHVKPVILGPLSYLWLGKVKGDEFDVLSLLPRLLPVYEEIFAELNRRNVSWVQLDEPILVLDLPAAWQQAYVETYQKLNFNNVKCLLATYFGSVTHHLPIIKQLPIQGLHIDLCAAPEQLTDVSNTLSLETVLSVGVINGRNIWRANLATILSSLAPIKQKHGEKLWVGSSCSLLHTPVDLDHENKLDPELKSWLAFAKQKVHEVAALAKALHQGTGSIAAILEANQKALQSRAQSSRIHDPKVKQRLKQLTPDLSQRDNAYEVRAQQQANVLNLPLLPTTTIGSFPQTGTIRKIRQDYKTGKIDVETYTQLIHQEIKLVIEKQESLDLDVLVHGEAERNDMVEYFGELLKGFAFTENGWVQSYGSRCVKPPIIYGDVSRPNAMTVEWIQYAQSLTKRHVKGMLTGPVTILAWSFVRDDQSHEDTATQIALALRDEVADLEKAGIKVIQIDEPAFREALPLQKRDWQHYLDWSVRAFRIAASVVADHTQIHTHMCYSEFNDIIAAIAALDADVITIENSRSDLELLKAFEDFDYPNSIGPGVYDIHSPRIPSTHGIVDRLEKTLNYIPAARLWVNPDCGLKTRGWPEVEEALAHMVAAAKQLRTEILGKLKSKETTSV